MSDVGETLRERRMALKIDVHEVEEATKIRAKYLRALENEEYNLLPGQAYVKSFLRTYADYLGLDPRAMVDKYRAQGWVDEDDPSLVRTTEVAGGRRPIVLFAIGILALIFVVGLLVGVLGGFSS